MPNVEVIRSVLLIKECIAITHATLNTQHLIQRELLFYVLGEKQRELAMVLSLPTTKDD
ncbi:hypothetical protein [Gilliamella sp. BG7]|uniref:hypothetical protein n=1 Tax=unclassified Gilliamella TaxID=2685620 RepID=UPI00267B2E54